MNDKDKTKAEATTGGVRLEREVRRQVVFTEGNAGIWDITCPTCPLKVHTDALGQKPQVCAHGIITNIQGPVPMGTCKHHKAESLVNEEKALWLLCTKAGA